MKPASVRNANCDPWDYLAYKTSLGYTHSLLRILPGLYENSLAVTIHDAVLGACVGIKDSAE
jgi:hypothetical protein